MTDSGKGALKFNIQDCYARCPNPRAGREKASKTIQLAKRGSLLLTQARASATTNAVVRVREPRAQAVTQIYRVSTRHWFKRIGYKFAKQFHWSKLLHRQDFPGVSAPFLIS